IIIPSINISGAALSMLLTNIVCLIYEVYVMRRKFGIETSVAQAAWKPIIAALISGAALYYFYNGFSGVLPLAAAIIISGILGSISYLLILILIDSEDFSAVLGILKRSKCT
ncbi:MAG: polysaccharide biosynthesis C-terminal domain-containing protein, partial [Ruminiclostridium sp.]